MDLAEYLKLIMLIMLLIAVASLLVRRNIIAKVVYVIAFFTQVAITFWAIASGQIESFASWIFIGFLILGLTILIMYSDSIPTRQAHNSDTKS